MSSNIETEPHTNHCWISNSNKHFQRQPWRFSSWFQGMFWPCSTSNLYWLLWLTATGYFSFSICNGIFVNNLRDPTKPSRFTPRLLHTLCITWHKMQTSLLIHLNNYQSICLSIPPAARCSFVNPEKIRKHLNLQEKYMDHFRKTKGWLWTWRRRKGWGKSFSKLTSVRKIDFTCLSVFFIT